MMEDMESAVNGNLDDDWTNGEPEDEQENHEERHEDDSESDFLSETDNGGLGHSEMNDASASTAEAFQHGNVARESDNATQNHVSSKRDYSPSFTGLGKCKCGCGSFVGCGSICEACGHSYKAHGPY